MGRFDACLVDAYNTIVYTDYAAHRGELPALAGLPADVLYGEFRRLGPAVGTGRMTLAEAFAEILRAGGAEPRPELVRALTTRTRELLLTTARLYDDVLPFLRELRSRGVKVAIVSNCDENTRSLLAASGVAALADALVLSCEVGAEKPEAAIYQQALAKLGVPGRGRAVRGRQRGLLRGGRGTGHQRAADRPGASRRAPARHGRGHVADRGRGDARG